MIVRRLVRALDSRLRFAPLARKGLAKVFPDQWTFMLGEVALYAFVVLVLTGIYLTLYFQPSTADTVYHGRYAPLDGRHMSAAYASSVSLSWDVRAGLLMRQTHHWAALVFIGAIVLHLMRIFFTGAFRKPREINWLVGVTMLTLAMLNGFSGYSMPDDLLSGTGLRIAYSVVESVPVAGGWLAFLVFGGEFPAEETVPRLYISHVLLVPAALAALIAAHMAILIRQKHSQFPGPGRTEHNVVGSRLWPTYTVRTLALFGYVLAILFALGGLFQINPVWLYGPFDPAQATSPAQPDWFVAWEEGALRLFPPADFRIFGHLVPTVFFPGVVLGAVTFLGLYAWPFVEARLNPDKSAHQLLDPPRRHPVRLGLGVAALAFYLLLMVGATDDIIARLLQTPVTGVLAVIRILVLAVPWPAGLIAFLLARALRAGDAAGLGDLTRADLRAALSRRRPPPSSPSATQAPSDGGHTARDVLAAPHTETFPAGRGAWRWRYVDDRGDEAPLVLTANVPVASEEAAAREAATAYPDAPIIPAFVADLERTARDQPERLRPGRLHRVIAVAALPVIFMLRRRARRAPPGE